VDNQPEPDIEGDNMACEGQVLTYVSNSSSPDHLWMTDEGMIIGPDNDSIVQVLWTEAGTLYLTQSVGTCAKTDTLQVGLNSSEAPPYHPLVYLEGGGVLLYPNESGETGL